MNTDPERFNLMLRRLAEVDALADTLYASAMRRVPFRPRAVAERRRWARRDRERIEQLLIDLEAEVLTLRGEAYLGEAFRASFTTDAWAPWPTDDQETNHSLRLSETHDLDGSAP